MIIDPTDITGCRAWYDASDGDTITESAGQVTQWNDKSGNGFDIAGTPTAVAVATAHQNGLDTIRFQTGSSNYLLNSSAIVGNGTVRTFAIVIRPESANPGSMLDIQDSAGPTYGQLLWLFTDANSNAALSFGAYSGVNTVRSDGALALSDYHIIIVTMSFDAGTGDVTVVYNIDGVDETADVIGIGTDKTLGGHKIRVGNYAYDADGYFAEIAVFDNVLSTGDKTDLFNYLNDKWAVVAGDPPILDDDLFNVDDDASVGATVGSVAASGGATPYSYAITAGNSAGHFSIDSSTGEITVADDISAEDGNSFSLTVEVTDDNSDTDDATIDIDVNDTTSDGITFTDFVDGQVIQRAVGATSKTITIAGAYTGSPTAIEYRIVEDGTDTAISGHDWRTLDATPAAGAFSGDVDVPQGGWYNIDLRFAGGSTPLFGGTHKSGVGINVFMIGQSNMSNMKDVSSSPPAANDDISMHSAGAWQAPAGNGLIALGNAINDALAVPVGLVEYAVSGSPISAWDPGSDWTAALAGLTASGGDCEFVLWHQGESDAIAGTTKASYKASLGNVYSQCRAATGRSAAELPFLVGLLSTILSPPYDTETDSTWQAIKDAHVEFCDEIAGAYLSANYVDVDRGGSSIHMSGAGYETVGARFAQSILYLLGMADYDGAGPRISSATIAGTTVRVRIEHDGGGDFTPTSGITGFEVLDDGAPVTISSAARQDANIIALALAAEPAGSVTLRYQYGEDPNISGAVKDDTALVLPLLYVNGLAVSSLSAMQIGARRLAVDMTMGL